jgi:hypothetical protein
LEAEKKREAKKLGFADLLRLLEKIRANEKPCKIEINYDGSDFVSWLIHAANVSAEEWNPEVPEKRLPASIAVERIPRMIHRSG